MKSAERRNGIMKKRKTTIKADLADRVIALVEEARKKVATAANIALVYTY